LAGLAAAQGDIDEVIRCWEVVLYRFPGFDRAYTAGAEAMRKVGREADADELLRQVVGRSPAYLAGHLEYARSAERRGDWSAAAERWALVRVRFPDCDEAREGEAAALVLAEQQRTTPDH